MFLIKKEMGFINMGLASSIIILLVFIGLFVLLYIIGGIMEALERYFTSRRKKRHNEKTKELWRV